MRKPGDLPDPSKPAGTDTLPQIQHIVVVMMENHSFDNYFGTLGRGEGLPLGADGKPSVALPDGKGSKISSFRMPSTCQLPANPNQDWNASHRSLGSGSNDGFVQACGPVAMGYWTAEDLPFYASLASTFPLCDRWFASCLAQTYPNRRFLMAGSAGGVISTNTEALSAPMPANGTIFHRLDEHQISWRNYYSDLPQALLFGEYTAKRKENLVKIEQFYADAASGNLPAFSLVDPVFSADESEENPADIRAGEAFVAKVVDAVLKSPAWGSTVLIWCYDEHGGYYDHVVPPAAIAPDDIAPNTKPGDEPGGYDRYGFRVPAVIVSPFAKKDYVSHVLHDHTSILKLVATKWNLPALTYRDANADALLDCLDLMNPPAFATPPTLAPAALAQPGARPVGCAAGAGTIPPADAVSSA